MSARLAFIIWATHEPGERDPTRFSIHHDIESQNAWQTALVLLALSEVVTRTGGIMIRGYRATASQRRTGPALTSSGDA